MLLESLAIHSQTLLSLDTIQYSPPKDAMDISIFNSYFKTGSYSLPESNNSHLHEHEESTQVQDQMIDELPSTFNLSYSDPIQDSINFDKLSVADSNNTCAQTNNSSSNLSTNSNYEYSPLKSRNHRSGKKSERKSLDLGEENEVLRDTVISVFNQRDIPINSFLMTDLSNKRIAKIAIQIIDRQELICEQEWSELMDIDHKTLVAYIENIYGIHLTYSNSTTLLNTLNSMMQVKSKGKRNEEKLKKTVKKVNNMITGAFVKINNIHYLEDDQLADILFSAYFQIGVTTEKCIDSVDNIFLHSLAFSQKAFCKIVKNTRYADDFEAILRTTYVSEFIKGRHDKVQKSIAFLRKKIECSDETSSKLQTDIIKRTPWQISEIIDGVSLCLKIIELSRHL